MNAPMKKHALPPADQAKDVQEWLERGYAAAIQANQYEEVVRFLKLGVNPLESKLTAQRYPFETAIRYADLNIIKAIWEKANQVCSDAEIEGTYHPSSERMGYEAYRRYEKAVEEQDEWTKGGEKLKQKFVSFHSLRMAINENRSDVVEWLLEQNIQPLYIASKDAYDYAPRTNTNGQERTQYDYEYAAHDIVRLFSTTLGQVLRYFSTKTKKIGEESESERAIQEEVNCTCWLLTHALPTLMERAHAIEALDSKKKAYPIDSMNIVTIYTSSFELGAERVTSDSLERYWTPLFKAWNGISEEKAPGIGVLRRNMLQHLVQQFIEVSPNIHSRHPDYAYQLIGQMLLGASEGMSEQELKDWGNITTKGKLEIGKKFSFSGTHFKEPLNALLDSVQQVIDNKQLKQSFGTEQIRRKRHAVI